MKKLARRKVRSLAELLELPESERAATLKAAGDFPFTFFPEDLHQTRTDPGPKTAATSEAWLVSLLHGIPATWPANHARESGMDAIRVPRPHNPWTGYQACFCGQSAHTIGTSRADSILDTNVTPLEVSHQWKDWWECSG